MKHYSKSRKASQARKQKLTEKLTGAQHGPTPNRSFKTVVRTSELAKLSHINVIAADERLRTGTKVEAKNFTQVPNELREAKISPGARWLWVELWGYCNGKDDKPDRNRSYPSQETLADRLNVSERAIRRHIKELRRNGLLKVEQTKVGLNNNYFLYAPELSPDNTGTQSRGQVRPPKEDKYVRQGNSADNDGHGDRVSKNNANKTNRNNTNTFTTEPTSSGELFGSVKSKELNDKSNDALNTNELIAKLQQHALSEAGLKWEPTREKKEKVSDEKKEKKRNKLRGQVEDLRDKLGGSGEVVKFYRWFFKDPLRVNRFRNAPNKFKFWKVYDERTNYETDKLEKRQGKREDLRMNIWIHSEQGEHLRQGEQDRLDEMDEGQLSEMLETVKDREVKATVGVR